MVEFKFNNKNSLTDFGIVARSIKRPLSPALRKKQLVIPGQHGTYDFGGSTYDNRFISVLLQFIGSDVNELRKQARDIAAWLHCGYMPLTFDDEPDKYYMAKIYDGIDLEVFVRAGEASVTFECQPFALNMFSTGEDILLNSDVPLDSDLMLDAFLNYTFAINGNTTLNIDYFGTQELGVGSPDGSLFDIGVTGSFTTLAISLNGKTLNFTALVGRTVIDNVNATVKTNGANTLSACSGDLMSFLKLKPGVNAIAVSGTGLNCTISLDFRPLYL